MSSTHTEEPARKNPVGSFFRYRVLVPFLVGLAASIIIAASRGYYQLDKTVPLSFEVIITAVLRALFDNPYLLLIPPILTQLLSTQFLAGEIKDTISSHEKINRLQSKELKELYVSSAQILKASGDLNSVDQHAIGHVSELVAKANTAVRGAPRLQKLLEWRKRELFRDLLQKLDDKGKGILSFDSEDEISLNIDIVSELVPNRIKAVSIDDGEYWKSEEGHTFVRDQQTYLRAHPGARIERIFIEKGQNEYQETTAAQRAVKINVGTINYDRAMAIYNPHRKRLEIEERAEDFVIYDDICVKKSRGIGRYLNGVEMKDPEMIFDAERVKGYVELYDRLRSACDFVKVPRV